MDDGGEIVGMVDVLKLTYATLDQINSMSSGDGEGPAWNKFWLSLEAESESQVSGEGNRQPRTPDMRSRTSPDITRADLMPHDSASHNGDEEQSAVVGAFTGPVTDETPFAFKFKAPSGRVHRVQVTVSGGIEELVPNVISKLGTEVGAVGGEPVVEEGKLGKSGFALSYLDNEGDTVSITTNQDLLEAITLARNNHREKVDLFVHDPEKPPLTTTVDPHPGPAPLPTPAESMIKERSGRYADESDEEAEAPRPARSTSRTSKHQTQQEQIVAGVPNELLLPGAIGALAVVIIGVFIVSRASSNR